MAEQEAKTPFKDWYDEKGEDLNATRRKRYSKDKLVRETARENAANYRKRRADGERIEQVRYRDLDGEKVQVFTSGYVADRVGVSSQSIVNWSARGWIPPCLFDERHRLYTKKQIVQIRRIAKSTRSTGNVKFQKMLTDINSKWRN